MQSSEKVEFNTITPVMTVSPIKKTTFYEKNILEFWKKIPAFNEISLAEFSTTDFQNKHTVTSFQKLHDLLIDIVNFNFLVDVEKGLHTAPMNLRVTPYILSLIDWDNPYTDPLRLQFIPLQSDYVGDHPNMMLDSLNEQGDSPVEGLVHRYFDKVLFLALDVCPVYCRFCTRSYAIGGNTDTITKVKFKPVPDKWKKAFDYIAENNQVEDVVISGGDAYMLTAQRILQIGKTLLDMPNIRRIRFASKGPAVMPMKILTDDAWTQALIEVSNYGRTMGKEVALHTHFNSVNEITQITNEAMLLLFKNGVKVRNQSVLIKGVNDTSEKMISLIKKLSYMNVQPYYVYMHDMVQNVEDMRTTLSTAIQIEKGVRGSTAGFNTPLFVMDAPGGGGKRDLHSYEYYNKTTGISIYKSPYVDVSKLYVYYDPINQLSKEGQLLWKNQKSPNELVNDAINQLQAQSL